MIMPRTYSRKQKTTGQDSRALPDKSGPEAVSQRDAYAQELVEMGKQFSRLVVLDADLSAVSKGCLFRDKYPERHVQVGVAEQNMIGIAAGMAQIGYIPIVHSLAAFITGRAYDQIRMALCYSGLNVKIVGLHAGVTLGLDGATHQTAEDIALMCALPGMCVLSPADAQQTRDLLPQLIELQSPAVQPSSGEFRSSVKAATSR
ncbi:MAG: hypothetical protein HY000_10100 [Planctomycetes bacterium]|nr:hypothetical protein [Planctomycetota bacterium]